MIRFELLLKAIRLFTLIITFTDTNNAHILSKELKRAQHIQISRVNSTKIAYIENRFTIKLRL